MSCWKSRTFSARWAVLLVMALLSHSVSTYAAGVNAAAGVGIFFDRVTGRITDNTGKPLEGVTVMVKGSKKGVSTDSKGQFTIEAAAGSTLVFSSAGYLALELPATSDAMTVVLKEDSKLMEEVYVGYQRVRKSDVTGAISSVKASEMNLSTPTISQALVGKVAGVQISQVSGAPYSGAKIRVRGVGSINASSEPLYVIDGYPVGGNISQGVGNGGNATNGYNPRPVRERHIRQSGRHRIHRDPERCCLCRYLWVKGFRWRGVDHYKEG